MGSSVPRGARPPSHVAYYVALAGILGLLVLLCFYFFYYFIRKVKELSQQDTPLQTPTCRAPPAPVATYPVQPVVRDSATAMAKLCKQLPAPASKGDTVFPTSTSPAALHTDTGDGVPAPQPEKVPAPAAATVLETDLVR
ncbi:uncharacterized protein LOC115446261 [Manduca sexta]|uniref:Uncharacterized protein n=1 Tax=Manduca sexta TaxID=7130 RepID=A0A921ZCH1_MANSE|nr:uncharacterized protein LOC115446261 [Manduca sexta]KAG6454374.1 hypothetical protein O3G_MSEX008662 [Manduca sexta]